MEVEYDESAWPIVVARWKRSLVDADVTPVLRKVDGWLARGRFGLLIDSRGAESLSPDQLLDEEFAPDTGDYSAEQEPPPAQQTADKTRRNNILRAPLPYWDIKDRKK